MRAVLFCLVVSANALSEAHLRHLRDRDLSVPKDAKNYYANTDASSDEISATNLEEDSFGFGRLLRRFGLASNEETAGGRGAVLAASIKGTLSHEDAPKDDTKSKAETAYTGGGARPVLETKDEVSQHKTQGADPEAVRTLPLDPGASRRDLQSSSSDACQYVSVSGSTYQSGRHGLYEATGTCNSAPSYECLDCSSSGQKIWYRGSYWVIGSAGCGSGSGGLFSPTDPDGDLAAISSTWEEWTGSAYFSNSDIAVTCESYCKNIPGTVKHRCFDCADASAQAYGQDQTCVDDPTWVKNGDELWKDCAWVAEYIPTRCAVRGADGRDAREACPRACEECFPFAPRASVGDGQCDAENNVDPCYDGGDCCETTCIDGDTYTCGSYDCADPDAPPVPDPYYPDAAWYLEAICVPEAWAAGYTGAGVQILINDEGVDNTHPDLAKLDVANSCDVYAPSGNNAHGTVCASLAAGDSNAVCGVGAAPDAGLASCVIPLTTTSVQGYPVTSQGTVGALAYNYDVNDISSNSWGEDYCKYIPGDEQRVSADCPFECPSVSSGDCPCDACDGDDWASGDLDSDCEDAVVDYCTNYFNDDVTPCLELDHYFVKCGYGQLSTAAHDKLVEGATAGRKGLGMVFVFAAMNQYRQGEDVNYYNYQNSRFTISVGALGRDLKHASYSSSGAPVFISAPGGDEYGMIAAQPLALAFLDNCGDAGVGTSYAAPLVSGVVALVLEANPSLTWRDVQGVLAATARTDFKDEDDEAGQWTTNQAGVKHSYKYGFGLVDALAATTAATTWTTLPAEITLVTTTTSGAALLDFDGAEHWVESEAAKFGSSDFVIEGVSVYVTIKHPRRGDLRIELERNGVTSLLTDDKLELGSGYTNWKYTTLRHWGETADNGAFTLRVADRRAGSGDDDDLGSRRRLADDDGVLVKWTLQLYGHDSDLSTPWSPGPWTPQPTPRGGCDSVAVSGSNDQTGRHGTYLPDGRCEDKVSYKCSDCAWTTYLWYHDGGYWAVGTGGCGTSSMGMYIITDEDLADVTGDWSEWTGSAFSVNSNIVVQCILDPPTYAPTPRHYLFRQSVGSRRPVGKRPVALRDERSADGRKLRGGAL